MGVPMLADPRYRHPSYWAPFLLIGEGTSEIQKTIISRGLLREYQSRG